MDYADPLDSDAFLVEVIRHEGVLRALSDGPADREEVEEVADVSTSTAYRLLGSLRRRGIVRRRDGDHSLTPVGEALLDELSGFRESVERLDRLRPVADSVPQEIGIETSILTDAKVTLSTDDYPYEPEWRFSSLLDGAERIRFVGGSSAVPILFKRALEVVSDGGEVTVVCPEEVAEANNTGVSANGSLSVLTGEVPSAVVALVDDRVCLGTHKADSGGLEALAETDDEAACAWGVRVYERYREEADEYP